MKALYYPHTQISNESILKSALLLWDEIQTIYPSHGQVGYQRGTSARLEEAAELVVTHRPPSVEQKRLAQEQLRRLLEDGVLHKICQQPQIAQQSRDPSGRPYEDHRMYRIFNDKFLHQT